MVDPTDLARIFTIGNTVRLAAARVESNIPFQYRLARSNGNLILQGCYQWQQGSACGHEWRDIPIFDLDQQEVDNG